ncbi:MAG: hypothetical protein CVU48_04890 [Candidatus Cloacimonetes bacterium HGW-Cloacimonetes-1]|nr:MAG: hypothetical protein CVU48_04890 [Candidatus Cloacimonetes bacterium HGW-Cloacimonetes-1]
MILILGAAFATNFTRSEVTVGEGNEQARLPVDMYWKNSLFQTLYFQDELNITNGSITGIKFYNNFVSDLAAKPVKIWMGTTTQTSLTAGWIPSGQLTLVFDGTVNFPAGQNAIAITLTTPFAYTGGTLAMMVYRPMDTEYFNSSDNFLTQTVGTTRSRNVQSDTTPFDPAAPPATATVSGKFPKTTFTYTGTGVANDLKAMSITGNTTPSAGTASPYVITIKNNGTATQSTYSVKLMKEGNVEIASVAGTTIAETQTLTYTIPWTPAATGATYLYGKVVLAGDTNPANDVTTNLPVSVQAAGVVAVTIGAGNETALIPVNMYYKNSLYETIYLNSELNIGGLITGVQFYNNFVTALPAKPTKIWLGTTTNTDLSTDWIPSAQLTSVFDGNVNYPMGQNDINITLTTPFVYTGGSLVMMVYRPMDTEYFSSSDFFKTQTVGTNRARAVYSDSTPFDPAAPPAAAATQLSGKFPKTTFFFITQGMGALSGTVNGPGGTPLAGVTVSVANTTYTTTTSATGTYSFPYVTQGTYQVTAAKLGYATQTLPAVIVEDQTTTVNFTMATLPQVSVTGTVVGSDQPTVGLADATITLAGYAPYTATTNASGVFTITGVYANNTYNYTVAVAGYQGATGTAVVGATNLNMGTVTVNEIALPAAGVTAAVAGNNVNVTWIAPDPNAQSFTDGFETYADFSLTMDPWTLVDVDLSTTYGFTGITFPNSGVAMSYIVFNPNTTVPATTGAETHGGDKYAACFASTTPPNNDWLITPQMAANGVFKFWARSFVADYGLERFKVGVSTTGTAPANFTIISGATYVQAPITWTEYTYDLAAYAGQQIRVGIQCLSNDAFIFMLDDVMLGTPTPTYLADINTNTLSNVDTKLALRSIVEPNYVNIQNVATPNRLAAKKDSNSPFSYNNRVMTGYKVYRLIQGQETNEPAWISLNENPISATAFVDPAWTTLNDGWYKWAVKAVYTNGVMAPAAFSNALQRLTQVGTIAGTVRNASNVAIVGATVTAGAITATTNASGAYSMVVPSGTYTVNAAAAGYVAGAQNGVIVVTGGTTAVNFILQQSLELLNDGFESYADFAVVLTPWTLVDVDQSTTYGFTGITFPGSGTAMSYIAFNPNTTTPAVTGADSHSGAKYAACFASTTPPNNDWMMTPLLNGGGNITFYARSFTADYGLERFKVGVSSGGTAPANFNIISGANYVEAPVEWTMFTYSLAAYAGQQIRIGIQCLSNDAFIFMVDDVVVMGSTANEDINIPAVTTALNNNYPNPFNPETTISYSVKEASPVTIEIYNVKGQVVRTLVSETKASGNHTTVWNGKDNNGRNVTSGVYFYKMNAGKYSSTRKMILMK